MTAKKNESKETKKQTKKAKKPQVVIPDFSFDPDNVPGCFSVEVDGKSYFYHRLSRKQFPKGKAGSVAYCEYMTHKWAWKKEQILAKGDPKVRLEKRRAKLLEKLADLEEKLGLKKS